MTNQDQKRIMVHELALRVQADIDAWTVVARVAKEIVSSDYRIATKRLNELTNELGVLQHAYPHIV